MGSILFICFSLIISVTVLLFIVGHVFLVPNRLDPCRVGFIPLYCLSQSTRERDLRPPAEFALCFGAIDGIAAIVTGPIGNVLDQSMRLIEQTEKIVSQFEVGFLAPAAEIVDFTRFPAFPRRGNAAAVVEDVNPIADLLPIPINRHLFIPHEIRDEERNQLFGELKRAVIIGTASDDGRESKRVLIGLNEQIGTSLACGIGTIGV